MNSVFYANSTALILVLLAWYSLYHLRGDLNDAISTEQVNHLPAAHEGDLAHQEREAHQRKLDVRGLWMSAANELLIQTSSNSWTTEDQREYERLRAKLNPLLVTPDYRKPPGEREFPVPPVGFQNRSESR